MLTIIHSQNSRSVQPPEPGQVQKVLNVDEDEVGALGDVVLQADAVQPVQEILPLLGIGVQQPVVVALGELQPGDGGLLQGGGGPLR